MQTITLRALAETRPTIDEMIISGFDSEIYRVHLVIAGSRYTLVSEKGDVITYRGVAAAKRPLTGYHVKRATLTHFSAYDEMIGLPANETTNQLTVPTSVPPGS